MIARSAIRIFHTHVAGRDERVRDGEPCQPGERLVLALAPHPTAGRARVHVSRRSGERLGHLPRHRLRRLAPRMARGWRYAAVVTEPAARARRRPPSGIPIAVFAGRPGVPDEVWEAALEAEVTPARRYSVLWVVVAALVVARIAWLVVH